MTKSTSGAELIQKIIEHLNVGGVVQITTYTRSWIFEKKHAGMFKVGKTGSPLMQSGKKWNDISGTKVQFGKWATT